MALAGALIFAAGAVTGGAVVRQRQQRWLREHLASDPAQVRTAVFLRALDARLSLDASQRARAESLLVAQSAEYRDAIELSRPRLRALRARFADELGPSLRPEQRASLAAALRELDARQR